MGKNSKLNKNSISKFLKFFVFISIGFLLFWLVYKDQPISEIFKALQKANYSWIILGLFLSVFSHISRALRWNILIESLGYKTNKLNIFFSILIMYLSNTAIPRSGEITRCGIVNKYENIPFTKLLGTVIIERIVDVFMLFILLIIVLLTQFNVFIEFFKKNPGINEKLNKLGTIENFITLVIISLLFIVAIFLFQSKMKNTKFYLKLKELLRNFYEGIKTIKNLEKKWEFISHSLFIWIVYFLTIYIAFWSFDFTRNLSLLTGLTVFVMASLGFMAPSPGGIGTWHFMVIETLVIYGIEKNPDASAFAFAIHGSMTLLVVFSGLIALILLPVFNKKNKAIESN